MKSAPKTYIGDGVYAECTDTCVVLTTEDGVSITNRIFLIDGVLLALINWLEAEGIFVIKPDLPESVKEALNSGDGTYKP